MEVKMDRVFRPLVMPDAAGNISKSISHFRHRVARLASTSTSGLNSGIVFSEMLDLVQNTKNYVN